MNAIRCQGLSRTYGSVEALKPLDLEIPTGTVFGFLGRNGAGKTTTIRLLTGLARPTSGKAWVAGVETTDGEDIARRQFGYLPEEPAFYTWMTPVEFLDYVGKLFFLNAKDRRQRIDELLELAGLADVKKRHIQGFSRGMRQRLGLAQALIHNPPVLFLDEPTSALDPAGRREVLDLIEQLRGETTIFLSSHILDDVEKVCDTLGVIRQGELLLVTGRDELLGRYAPDTALIEFETAETAPLLSDLQTKTWVTNIQQEDKTLRVTVNDLQTARQALLPLVAAQGIPVNRYEWLRPTLEDIFLSLSE
ncbi:MAG: ABC transporter ATP-binding protein [Candidatus Promineifilaceae bacterium]